MKANGLKQLWASRKAGLNGWLSVPNAFTAEVMGSLGYDSLTIDMQHGLVDYKDMVGMLQALSSTSVTAMVRVPWLDPASIMNALSAQRVTVFWADPGALCAGWRLCGEKP